MSKIMGAGRIENCPDTVNFGDIIVVRNVDGLSFVAVCNNCLMKIFDSTNIKTSGWLNRNQKLVLMKLIIRITYSFFLFLSCLM